MVSGKEGDEIVRRDHQVAVEEPFEAAADRIAMDGADDRLVAAHQEAGDLLDRRHVADDGRLTFGLQVELPEIVARAEGAPDGFGATHRAIGGLPR